jgi:hypothetical protein
LKASTTFSTTIASSGWPAMIACSEKRATSHMVARLLSCSSGWPGPSSNSDAFCGLRRAAPLAIEWFVHSGPAIIMVGRACAR